MGKGKGTAWFFASLLIAGVAGWSLYQIIINAVQDSFSSLSQSHFLNIDWSFLQNIYVQNGIIIAICFGLLVLAGYSTLKALEEILD